MSIDPKISVIYVLENQKSDLQILLGIAGFALGLGFLFGIGNNQNYDLIFSFGNHIFWGCLFLLYSASKLYGSFFRLPKALKFATNVTGLWAWNYIFLSFTFFDTTPVAPTELLLTVPIIIEFWTMLAAPFNTHQRRKRDQQC